MSSKKKQYEQRLFGRRQFLIGSGSMLMLPPLLSLMPEKLMAQVMSTTRRRALTWIGNTGIDPYQFYPNNPTGMTAIPNVYSGFSKPLSSFTGPISRMIDADFASMYPHMNLIEGLSLTGGERQGHNIGILAAVGGEREPTLGKTYDVIMKDSTAVYKTGEAIPHRLLRIFTTDYDLYFSWDRVNGKRVVNDGVQSDRQLFNTLFANFTAPGTTAPASEDKLIVDKVYADLKALEGNKRISAGDKIVLDRYISSLYDLQLKVNSQNPSGPACQKPTLTLQAGANGNYWQLPFDPGWKITNSGLMFDNYVEMIKLAFACDLTRVVTISNSIWDDAPIDPQRDGGLHHECPGSNAAADRQKWGLKKFLKIAKALSSTTDPFGGGTLLDNSIMLYTNEMGDWTEGHTVLNLPVLTFGKAAGFFNTGNYVDFRQKPLVPIHGTYLGRPFKQMLQSVMASVGVPKSEYMKYGDGKGFGQFRGIDQFGTVLPNAFSNYTAEHNDPLPFVTKAA